MSVSASAGWLNLLPRLAARFFGLDHRAWLGWQRLVWTIALALTVLNGLASVQDSQAFDGFDLRIRVVGARLLLRGIDPYSYSSSPDYPPELQDPGQEFQGLSRCSYPPPLLLLYAPLSPLPYPLQRSLWMGLEWLALMTLIALLCRLSPSARVRFLTATAGLGLVASSYLWRFHVERGQYYVFIALALALGVRCLLRCRTDHLGAGALFGLAIAMRPPIAVLLLPLWLGGLRRTALSGALTAGLAVAVTLPLAGPATYGNYLRMARDWEQVMFLGNAGAEQRERLPREKGVIDGYRNGALEVRGGNWTVGSLLVSLRNRLPGLPAILQTTAGQKIIYVVVLALWLGLFYLAHRARPFSVRETVLAGAWLVVLTDYFLPMRVEYADVLHLLPMALAMPALARARNQRWLLALVLAWLPMVVAAGPHSERYWVRMVPARGLVLLTVCALPWLAAWRGRLWPVRRALARRTAPRLLADASS